MAGYYFLYRNLQHLKNPKGLLTSLVIYRLLGKRLHEEFTCHEIIKELREMNFKEIKGEGYEPIYTRTDFTVSLHEAFGFHTDYQIVTKRIMKKICKETKT